MLYALNQGDLRQAGIQSLFLRRQGFDIQQEDVFPALSTKEEYIEALSVIYRHYVESWWNYKDQCVQYGICTADEFQNKFTAFMKRKYHL